MKKAILCLAVLILGSALAFGSEERDLRHEISLLNLVNGLYLTEDQLVQLVDLSREADRLRDEFKCSRETEEADRLESFQNLREKLVDGANVDDEIQGEAAYLNRSTHKLRDQYRLQLYRLAKEAEGVFTEGQKKVIEDFKACLIPPRDLRNPERAGQTGDSGHIEKMMSRLRDAPPHRYERIKERIIGRHIERFALQKGPRTDEEIEAERRRVSELIDSGRDASDVDYEIAKKNLAKEFKSDDGPPKGTVGKRIARFFFCEQSTGVLEDKLDAARSAQAHVSQ